MIDPLDSWLSKLYQKFLEALTELGDPTSPDSKDKALPEVPERSRASIPGSIDIWTALLEEGNHRLIEKLRAVEDGSYCCTVFPVPREGFSLNTDVHNEIRTGLLEKGLTLFNPFHEEACLERTLQDTRH